MPLSRYFRRRNWDGERAREIQAYLEIETDANLARGMAPGEARHAAYRKFGNPVLIREEIYQMNTIAFLETTWQDLRYAARLLRLNPGFAAVAILSLALGIGANTAIFQLLDAVRLRPLPVRDSQELAEVKIKDWNWSCCRDSGFAPQLTNAIWEQIRDRQQAFSSIAAWGDYAPNLSTHGEARLDQQGLFVSGTFFEVLGVRPVLGRTFTPADDHRGCGSPGAVISYAFWQSEFGGQRSAVGKTLSLDGHPFQVIGVTPADFFGVEVGRFYDVAIPICAEPMVNGEDSMLNQRWAWWLSAIGRLKPGWTVTRAAAQFQAMSPSLFEARLPTDFHGRAITKFKAYRLSAFPAGTGISPTKEKTTAPLSVLLAISDTVLTIACVNLANLMLARTSAREREISVRLAIGASRGRLVGQLLTESLLLAGIGSLAGLALARFLSAFLVSFLSTEENHFFFDLSPDWRVLAFTAGVAIFTCVLFGLAPALRATRATPAAIIQTGGRGLTASRERFALRRGLVVLQIALSLLLVVAALLFVGSVHNLLTRNAGFQRDGILIADVVLTGMHTPFARRIAVRREVLDQVRAIPGVESAAGAHVTPVSGDAWRDSVYVIKGGHQVRAGASFNSITAGYFRTLRIPMFNGRDFNDSDTPASPKVAVVNEEFARRNFPGANPVGATFRVDDNGAVGAEYRIIGLAGDTVYDEMKENFKPIIYLAATQDQFPGEFDRFLIRSNAPMEHLTSAVRATFARKPGVQFVLRVLNTQIRESLVAERLMATLSGFFGFLAALLATVGLYGVISYMVARRVNEIGIRMALGAERRNVLLLILREAGWLLAVGLGLGTALALGLARTASSLLYGLRPNDPMTILAAVTAMAVVALGASYVPARRAARLEPMRALREE